jgi:hypothetical protein
MSRLLDRLLEPIEYVPCIPGLTVIEPETVLERNLAAADFERACKSEAAKGGADMDDTAQWAVEHPEICR